MLKLAAAIGLIIKLICAENDSLLAINGDSNSKSQKIRRWWIEDESGSQTRTPDGITEMSVTFLHTKVVKVNEKDNEIQIYIKGSSTWKDDRIKTNFSDSDVKNGRLTLPWEVITEGKIWIPIAFTRNLIKVNSIVDGGSIASMITNVELLTNTPSNENVTLVRGSYQVKYTVACVFKYDNYPIDKQICPIRTFTEPSQNLKLSLYDPKNKFHKTNTDYEHLGFDITTTYMEIKVNNSEKELVTEIGFDLTFDRIYKPFIYQYYIPCIAIVMVSSLNFLVPMTAIPGRISLLVTNFLTLTLIYINQITSNPSGTTFTALGQFLLISKLFGLAGIIQFAFVLFLRRHEQCKRLGKVAQLSTSGEDNNVDKLINLIDTRSCILYVATYFAFNIIYWICYTCK